MNFLSVFMAVFSVIGGLDIIIGNRFGIGKEFEKGFMLFGVMAMSMIGMIIISPLLGELMQPLAAWIYNCLHIDPSVLPAVLFANDMGGASLAEALAQNNELGMFNALVVSSMMGCTISFTIPVALNITKPQQHNLILFGFLCGIITIPTGCFISGLVLGLNMLELLFNLLPMIIFSIAIACGLLYFPDICIKIFGILGVIIKTLITAGLVLGIIKFLTGLEIVKGLAPLEDGAGICLNASIVMTGAFPFLFIVSKIIAKPLKLLGNKLNINKVSALGLFSSLATSITTFNLMEKMDDKGLVLNSAFVISGAFTFAGHLAFTMSYNSDYVFAVIIGKLISGVASVLLAIVLYKRTMNKEVK